MGKNKNKSSDKISLTLSESLLPISLLIIMLSFNVYVYGDNSMSGSNQFILLLGAAVGIVLGLS
jgi:NhaC family Na+:H+ antiporter